jgi:hypothetical protein
VLAWQLRSAPGASWDPPRHEKLARVVQPSYIPLTIVTGHPESHSCRLGIIPGDHCWQNTWSRLRNFSARMSYSCPISNAVMQLARFADGAGVALLSAATARP